MRAWRAEQRLAEEDECTRRILREEFIQIPFEMWYNSIYIYTYLLACLLKVYIWFAVSEAVRCVRALLKPCVSTADA